MSWKRCFAIFLFSVFCSVSQASVSGPCLEASSLGVRLSGFIIELFEEGVLGATVLEAFVQVGQDKEQGKVILESALSNEAIYFSHFKNEFAKLNEAEWIVFRVSVERFLSNLGSQAIEESQIEFETRLGLKFVRIQKGSVNVRFQYSNGVNWKQESMSEDIEVMNTHVTLGMFQDVVGQDLRIESGGIDHPVYKSNIWMAMLFANRLSEERGFEPVYDLPNLTWNPELLIFRAVQGQTLEGVVKQTHLGSGKPPGYRLPTAKEWKFILGSVDQELKWGPNSGALVLLEAPENNQYIWSLKNSGGLVQPVATRDPFSIQGQELFDLYGLANHWVHPVSETEFIRTFFMDTGSYDKGKINMVSTGISSVFSPNTWDKRIGFRLVREVSP